MVLRPHFRDMEYKLRPGMITLTWTSMNIDAYKAHIHAGLRKLEELVANINDIIELSRLQGDDPLAFANVNTLQELQALEAQPV